MGLLTQDQPIATSVITEDSATQSAFLSKVYGLLLVGLVTAAGGAYLTMTNQAIMGQVMAHPILTMVLYFAVFFGCMAARRVPGLNILALLAFTLVSGAFLAPVLVFAALKTGSMAVVYEAAIITGSIFGGLTLYTLVSKKDFSFLAGVVNVGLWAVLGIMLVNFFVKSQAADLAVSWIGSVLFSLWILYDTSRIMRTVERDEYVTAALSLYLDVINLFLFILRILSSRRD
ncbi:MAG TPA: Bax inhibitor-1 family protein [bacterium]|nr:Bax inhibitor-1 family protein [bacterium]